MKRLGPHFCGKGSQLRGDVEGYTCHGGARGGPDLQAEGAFYPKECLGATPKCWGPKNLEGKVKTLTLSYVEKECVLKRYFFGVDS